MEGTKVRPEGTKGWAEGPKPEARRAEIWGGVLGRGKL